MISYQVDRKEELEYILWIMKKDGYNPIIKQSVQVIRRKLNVNLELPRQNYIYSKLIAKLYDNIIVTSKIKDKNNNKKGKQISSNKK